MKKKKILKIHCKTINLNKHICFKAYYSFNNYVCANFKMHFLLRLHFTVYT